MAQGFDDFDDLEGDLIFEPPEDNPRGRLLSGPERDGLLTYRPSLPGRPTYRVTEDDAETIAAEPSTAQRHRIAKERGLQGPVPRAKAVLVDAATGGPRKPGEMGAYSTGRYVATIDGQRIEVDPEDIIIPTRSSPPTRGGLRFDYGAPAGYLAQARQKKEKASKTKPKRGRKKPKAKAKAPRCPPRAPGLRTTFKSSTEAAKLFYDGNALFFDHVRDPYDGLRDVFDGIEVRVGKHHKKLGHTPKGQAILQAQPADAIRKTLQAIFARTRTRRWDEVDWPLIERLGESLQPYFEPYDPSEPSRPGLYWRPFLGELDPDALAELDPDTLGQVADCESRRELGAALERLREVYAANRKCLDPRLRRMVERRLQEWEAWQDDPSAIPPSACAPDPHTGGMTCDYPALFEELRQLRGACEVGYNPLWATQHIREGHPGFPDLTGDLEHLVENPEDEEPAPEVAASAADESQGEAPLRVVYSYPSGILICGETYPHRDAIKGLRTKRFKYSRRLPDDCAWYVPRTRDRHASRSSIEQIATELQRATGLPVAIDYTPADPSALTSMEEREAALAERSEARVDRLETRAEKKRGESEAAYARSKDIADRIPFGQPVLVDHYSAKRHRRDLDKIGSGMRKSFELEVESEALKTRAKASERAAKQRQDPNFAQRRIEELQTELRSLDVTLTGEAPEDWRGLMPHGPATGDYKTQLEVRRAEILDQLGYWRRLIEESGVKVWGPEDFQLGDVLVYGNGGFDIVVRVNKKTLTIDSPPHMWDLKKPYTNIKRAPVRGTDAWRKAIEFYLDWLEARTPQPRVFPARAKMARAWLAQGQAPQTKTEASTPSWTVEDFSPGDVVHDDTGQWAVVIERKAQTLVVEAKNKDTGRLQRHRLSPMLVRGKLERGSKSWKDALGAYLAEIPDTDAHASRRDAARQWLGLPAPKPATSYEETLEGLIDALPPTEAAALVRSSVHGTIPITDIIDALTARGLFNRRLNIPTDLGHQIAGMLRQRPEHAPEPASAQRVEELAAALREGEIQALTRAHRLGRVGQVYGSILRRALHDHGLFDYQIGALTPLGHQVAEELLHQRPGLNEDGPANTRPPDPPGSLRVLTGWPKTEIDRKDIAAALRKLLRHRHPEVAFSIRTPNYSMARTIDLQPKENRRWNEAEKAVLRAVFGPDLAIAGNDATVSPWDRVHEGGTVLMEPYVEDFKALLAGKKPASKRPRTRASKSKKQPRATSHRAKAPASPPQPSPPETPSEPMNQLSIWEVPVPTNKTKNPGRPKAKAKPKANPKPKPKSRPKANPKPKSKRRRPAPSENPSRSYHLVASHQALEKAERMLALAEKAPKDSISQRSAAIQAHSEAVLAHQNAGYVLNDGPLAPAVRDNLAKTRRKAASIARQAQVIVGAEKRPARRPQTPPTPNPGRGPRHNPSKRPSPELDRVRRALRRL